MVKGKGFLFFLFSSGAHTRLSLSSPSVSTNCILGSTTPSGFSGLNSAFVLEHEHEHWHFGMAVCGSQFCASFYSPLLASSQRFSFWLLHLLVPFPFAGVSTFSLFLHLSFPLSYCYCLFLAMTS